MHIDPNKNEINDNYDKALTAQWAAFWLSTYHYNNEKEGKNTMLIFNELEQKGFYHMNNGNIDLRIRADADCGCNYPS